MSASESWKAQKSKSLRYFFARVDGLMTVMNEYDHMRWAVQTHAKSMATMEKFWTLENEWCVHYIQSLQGMPEIQRQIMGRDPTTLEHVGEPEPTHWVSLDPIFDPCDIDDDNPTICIQYPGSQGLCGLNACSIEGTFAAHHPQMTAVPYFKVGKHSGRGNIQDPKQALFTNAAIMIKFFSKRFGVEHTFDEEGKRQVVEAWQMADLKCAENFVGPNPTRQAQICDNYMKRQGWDTPTYHYPILHMAKNIPMFVCLMMMLDNPADRPK